MSRERGVGSRHGRARLTARALALLVASPLALASPLASAAEPDDAPTVRPAVDALLIRAAPRTVPLDRARLLGVAKASHYERSGFTLHGLPVRGAHETALVDDDGALERVVLSVTPRALPQFTPEQAVVSAARARSLAIAHQTAAGSKDPGEPEQPPELVYLDILGTPVLVWETHMPLDLSGDEPTSKTLYVSAMTGRVLHEVEHVRAVKTTVYPINPATTPDPVEVELTNIETGGPGHPLTGSRVVSYNCTLEEPENEEDIFPWWDEGECYAKQITMSDENGDFSDPIPDISDWDVHTIGDDNYAEISMFYHGERMLHELEKYGIYEFRCEVAYMLANVRYSTISVSYPDLDYGPLNNAYYTGKCELDKGPTMMFGQGSAVDYAYDGDVVYHEMGHGMVGLLTPDGLSGRAMRPDALLTDAGGLNESIADYFAIMMTDSHLLGDYVALYWPGYGKSYIRTGENTKVCPDDTIGQVHNDGEPFTAAMWAARKRVGHKLDNLMLEMLTRLPNDADLETASNTILALAKAEREKGAWSDEDLEHLYRAFDSRGLYDCQRVITDPEQVERGRSMYLRGVSSGVTPFWPGPMQLRHEVPLGSDNMIVSFRLAPRQGSTGNPNTSPVDARVLIKWADEPIHFDYVMTSVTEDVDGELPKQDVDEVIGVVGDYDEVRTATLLGSSDNELVIRGLTPGTVAYFTLVNTYTSESVASSFKVTSVPAEFLDQGSAIPDAFDTDTDTDTDTDGPGDTGVLGGDASTSSACACRSGQGHDGPLGAGLAALALLAWRRRRDARRESLPDDLHPRCHR